MKKRTFWISLAVIGGAIGAPLAASAQTTIIEERATVGAAPRADYMISETDYMISETDYMISETERPASREYVVRERLPSYPVGVVIARGSILPETGVTYYDVPQQYGATTYRYTVLNDRPVLVEPRSRRIMQVID